METMGFTKGEKVLMGGSIGTVTGFGVRSGLPVVVVECPDYSAIPIRVTGLQAYGLTPLSTLED